MEFDWNPAKCAKNIAERGIDFADVLVAFIDPTRKVAEDNRKNYGETVTTCSPSSTAGSSTSPSPNAARLFG